MDRSRRGAPESPAVGEVELEVRPIRIRWVAWILAVFLVAFFGVGALLATVASTGFSFRPADRVAMVVLGVVLAAGVLLLARPRLRAGPRGVEVRAALLTRVVPWDDVLAVSFPDGQQFARVDLPDDEYITIGALQAVDRAHAARGIAALRELHARHGRPADPVR